MASVSNPKIRSGYRTLAPAAFLDLIWHRVSGLQSGKQVCLQSRSLFKPVEEFLEAEENTWRWGLCKNCQESLGWCISLLGLPPQATVNRGLPPNKLFHVSSHIVSHPHLKFNRPVPLQGWCTATLDLKRAYFHLELHERWKQLVCCKQANIFTSF